MSERRLRHRYPKWLAWPIEIVALLIAVPVIWYYVRANLQILFQQWPQTFHSLGVVPYAQQVALILSGPIPPGPVPWEELYTALLRLNIRTFGLVFLAALIRNFLPQLRAGEEGLQVRRGLGWATVPWSKITLVHSMALPGDRLVLLVQGRRLGLGPWFRLYSLFWPAGLSKGILVTWHISDFDFLAQQLVAHLQQVYGDQGIAMVVDDSAYSLPYALLFLPRVTWQSITTAQKTIRDAYSYPKWVTLTARLVAALLVGLSLWRYLGVWWRFLAGRFPDLLGALRWPVVGFLLRTYGQPSPLPRTDPAAVRQAAMGLLAAQISMILVLAVVFFLNNLFPKWLLGAEGVSVQFRKKWLSIPWQAIRSIRETIFSRGGGVVLLQTESSQLTFWHTLYSLFYGARLRRGVLFTSLLPGFDDLQQRIHLGIVRTYEQEAISPEQPILQENGEADFLLMAREPVPTLRKIGQLEEEEEEERAVEGSPFKRPLSYTPTSAADLPWDWDEDRAADEEAEAETLDQKRALRAALTLALIPCLLVLLEEALFPPLSRPLAFLKIGAISLGQTALSWLPVAVGVGLLVLLEWLFSMMLMGMIAEMHDQPMELARARAIYPRVQTPRILVGLILIALGATGIIQPLFLLWWLLAGVWGAILLWLTGRVIYNWSTAGNGLLLAGYSLYQGLVLLLYLLFH